jgi:cytochrome c biogenesis protein
MKSIIQFFSSVKLAIVLIIIITIASILGTLIPQQRSAAEYVAGYGQFSDILTRLEITNLYHSWWFISLLFFFSLNILVCTLTRFMPKIRRSFRPKLEFEKKNLQVVKINSRFTKKWSRGQTEEGLKRALSSRHYRTKVTQKENRTYILARKRMFGLFGSDVVHLGLLVILAGGIISGVSGIRANIKISEGQSVPVLNADFKLQLEKFKTEYWPNGSVKDWKSTLAVLENSNPVLTKTVEVNHPLSYKGFVFYQSGYGWDWENPTLEILAKKNSDPSFTVLTKLKPREKVKLDKEDIEIEILHFVPDFFLNERNEVATRSLEPNNPAAFIQGWKGEDKIFSGWIFAKYPDFARMHSDAETDLKFELQGYEAAQYSVIQMSKDPGVNCIWAGSIILMTGLFLAFFWLTREIKIILEDDQDKTELVAGGLAAKNKEVFQSEFESIFTSLRRSK